MMTRRDALAVPLASVAAAALRPHCSRAADRIDSARAIDGRLGAPKTLDDYFPFAVPNTKEQWAKRRKRLREQVLVATGLWPMPEKLPIAAVVHGIIEREGYTVEKVFFTSMPGHYVSGNLYRPADGKESKPAKRPAILSPHGHWANGRFYEAPEKEVDNQLKMGAERTREGAKYPLQARCATLARKGFVVFHYDMVGTADSTAIAHREGFKDAAAELRLQSFMGLQTWNSIRALDFVEALPDVDPKRIGVTGASGGGTQTFILCAIDDRPAAAFPAVMVGTAMQGGCVCENCSGLRVNTGNVELAAMFAPKPLAMSGANDWTKDIMTKGFPELQQLYAMLGAGDKVAAKAWVEFPHNYNQIAREFMYTWFTKHLLGVDDTVKEPPFVPVPPKELSVYDAAHPRPSDEVDATKLRTVMAKESDAAMAKLFPRDAETLKAFRRVVGTALRAMVNDEMPNEISVRAAPIKSTVDGLNVHRAALGRIGEKDAVPGFGVTGPKGYSAGVVVWLHPKGKASLFENEKAIPTLRLLTDAGFAVVAPDILGIGDLAPKTPFKVNQVYAGFTYGYNRSLLANRVHDALTLIAFGKTLLKATNIHLVGWGEMGPVAVLAKALAGEEVAKTAADMNRFQFEAITDTADPLMLPGAVKYGGMPAFLALCAPGAVLAHNHKSTASGKLPKAAYDAASAADKLTSIDDKLDDLKVAEWLAR